jgi:hypothetical protein
LKQYPSPVSFAAVLVLSLGITSCVDHGHHPRIAFASTDNIEEVLAAARPKPTRDGRVILITIDGVRAEDVFDGADPALRPGAPVGHLTRPEAVMPRTFRLAARRGVALGADRPGCGVVRTASGANVSLPGYLEIFTGRKTRCRDNKCAPTDRATLFDEAAQAGLWPVASIGSWEILDHAVSDGSANVLVAEGTQRWPGPRPVMGGHMEELVSAGERSESYPGYGKYRPDVHTAAIALEYLRTAVPTVLHVGLGDADEWGHRDDYSAYLQAIGKTDTFIGQVADTLDSMGELGQRTTVLITTDHGRNQDFRHHAAYSPTAARTFVIAFGARVPARGVVCSSRDVTLADIAPTIREILGLARDTSPEAGRPIEEIVEPRTER